MERTTDVMQRAAYAGLAAADESVEGAAAVGPKKPGKHPALGKFKGAARKLQVGNAMDKAHKVQVEQMCCGCQPIEPKSLLRAGWDAWIMCTIAWVVTVIPVRCVARCPASPWPPRAGALCCFARLYLCACALVAHLLPSLRTGCACWACMPSRMRSWRRSSI